MAMLLLSDAPLHPTPPLSPSFRDEGASLFPKLINKISRSTKTHVWSGLEQIMGFLCVCVFIRVLIILSLL